MPRSPSRDLSDRFTGNRRYFGRSEWLRRDRYFLAAVALVLACCWAVADFTGPPKLQYAHTHGPLASPHAAWENDCSACHRGHSPSELSPNSVFHARDRWQDMTCEKCHSGALHNARFTAESYAYHAQCSNCHRDHAGRDVSLVRLADSVCTHCHANLTADRMLGTPKCEAKVTDFVKDHPEFRPLKTPPQRTLKFSHALHMNPGQTHTQGGKEAMTVGKLRTLASESLDRYRKPGQADGDLISLDCASCHRVDSGGGIADFDKLKLTLDASGEPSKALLPARAAGANMLPINFEMHCKACHPLRAPEGTSGGFVIAGFEVPHRKKPDVLMPEVNAGYVRSLVKQGLPTLATPLSPGGMLDPRLPDPARFIREETQRLTNTAMDILTTGNGGCEKCHDTGPPFGSSWLVKIKPLPDNRVWFKAAMFDHTAHRGATCQTCHPGTSAAWAAPGTALIEKEPPQILGVESCKACHSPTGTRVTLPDKSAIAGGGVRHGCTDCHRYHNNDHGLQGRGAAVLYPMKPLDLSEFLRGKKQSP